MTPLHGVFSERVGGLLVQYQETATESRSRMKSPTPTVEAAESNPRKISTGRRRLSVGRWRITPAEREVDRVLERERSPCVELG
jgi:hypothetical protein